MRETFKMPKVEKAVAYVQKADIIHLSIIGFRVRVTAYTDPAFWTHVIPTRIAQLRCLRP